MIVPFTSRFDAYGLQASADDPVAVAIHGLCQQLKVMDVYNRQLAAKLDSLDIDTSDILPPEVNTDCIELEPSKPVSDSNQVDSQL